jgi:hypothetical protein
VCFVQWDCGREGGQFLLPLRVFAPARRDVAF